MIDIKYEISALAKSLNITKFGFKNGAFVALFPYYVKGETGNISMYARGRDYHIIAEEKLKPIAEKFSNLGADYAEIHVDKGKLNDRAAAFEAGLGFYGKNGMLICEEFGSYFFIGQVVHNLNLPPDKKEEKSCLNCGKCIKFCVGGALFEKGFDLSRCVSDITQKKGELSKDEEALIIKNKLCWGCDKCQEVCPHNTNLETTALEEFKENRITNLEKDELSHLSNKEFKKKFSDYAFSWRGKNVLIRNLGILETQLKKEQKRKETEDEQK